MIDRNTAEEYLCEIGEKEWEHRFAHALLESQGLYKMWTEAEIETLEPVIEVDFKDRTARFVLKENNKFTPSFWLYVITNMIENKNKKK